MVAGALFTAAFSVIGIRVVDVSVFSDNSEPRYTRSIATGEKHTGRADIVDRNGILMATSLNTASLFANPRLILDPEQAAIRLASRIAACSGSRISRGLANNDAVLRLVAIRMPLRSTMSARPVCFSPVAMLRV